MAFVAVARADVFLSAHLTIFRFFFGLVIFSNLSNLSELK